MAVVVFDYNEFIEQFPELKNLTEEQLQGWFDTACCIVNNTDGSIVCDVICRKKMLYLLTAHYGTLFNRGAGAVGSMTSASEGSVSVGYSANLPNNLLFFGQTQYGLMYWQLILPYRTGRYVTEC